MKTQEAVTKGGSAISRYQDTVVGSRSIWTTIYFECCLLLSHIPGGLGLLLRRVFWSRLFGTCGRDVVFAENIILRHPKRIHIEDHVVISEGCILDARSHDKEVVITLKENVILSNNVMISCKGGSVIIGERTGIGVQVVIHSSTDEPVSVGSDVIIGPKCYIVGGGNYNIDRIDIPISHQGKKLMGGSTIENDVWLGANSTVLGGVTIRSGSIVGAGAVVTKSVHERSICAGVPARVIKTRG
jgi:galactoside O-acetyltransferase